MQVEHKEYAVFKGLQKPLVFKGYKGKFIYWLAGGLLSAFILCVVSVIFINAIVGVIIMIVIIAFTVYYVNKEKKYGINKKEMNYGVISIKTNQFNNESKKS